MARTETPGVPGHDLSYRGQFNYAGDRYGLVLERLVIEEGFKPEVGFVRRPNMRKWTGTTRFSPRPRRVGLVRKYLYEATGSYIENNAGLLETRQWDETFGLDFDNGDTLRVQATQAYEFLARPFEIDRAATIPIGGYSFNNLAFRYTLGAQRWFASTLSVEQGGFYDGHKTTAGSQFGAVQCDQSDPGAAGLVGQLGGPAVWSLHRHASARTRGVHADAAGIRRGPAAVQLQQPAPRHQPALAVGIRSGQRALRGLHRRARCDGEGRARSEQSRLRC